MNIKERMIQQLPSMVFETENEYEDYAMIDKDEIQKATTALRSLHFSLILEFCIENFRNNKGIALLYVFENADYGKLLVLQSKVHGDMPSIAHIFPTAVLYEREIRDGFGIDFKQSDDNRRLFLHEHYPDGFHPLKKSFDNAHIKLKDKVMPSEEYAFKRISGEGVYEIPVGPIHAGIIAPGHFRFSAIGETVLNLEIRHFWKHRGIEKCAELKSAEEGVKYAESICGDETVANALAYCMAIERISGIEIPKRAEYLRILFAEMERVYSLLGDLAGMVIDVAFAAGASQFFNLREEILRWNEMLCGSRFYKGALVIGGIEKDVLHEKLMELEHYLAYFRLHFKTSLFRILENASVCDRFETTGVISKNLISPLNLTGPLARASGKNKDERISHPYSKIYDEYEEANKVLDKGDVLARFRIKARTIRKSVRIILKLLKNMPKGPVQVNYHLKDGCSFAIVESSRGQNIVFVNLRKGKVDRLKVRTASFCNWYAIEHAVMGNIVPDFPLINKSLNLSYEGNDL
jgi:formate hydrogenlyase subunit 5